jgi:hypothetical protein
VAGAVCSPADCDEEFPCGFEFSDQIQCRTVFSRAGTVFRRAAGSCDVAEVCTGTLLNCPDDRHPPNGTTFADDGNPCTDDVCQAGACAHPNKADGTTCGPGKVCQAGTCRRAPGSDTCGEVCTELQSDHSNCGSCDRVCGNGHACCHGECAKLSSDEKNCGRCGKRCRNGQHCRAGRCVCPDGRPPCAGI